MSRTMRQVFGDALVRYAEAFPEMVVLDADVSSSTQTKQFQAAFPDRFFNFGIAEGNMAAAAAGMAACGKIPVISTFAFLLAVRAMDSIHSLAAYNRLNVKICGGYAGLSDFADGASHQGICDMAMMRAVPGIRILAPSDEESTMEAVGEMLRIEGPVYLRLSRDAAPSLHGGRAGVRLGKANLLMDGRDVTLVSTGTMLAAAIEARALLKAQGIDAAILEAISVKPLDEEAVCRMAERTGRVVTLEEHTVNGGLGDAVCAALCRGRPTPVLKIGLEDTFGQSARSYAQLVAAYSLDGPGVARQVENFVRGH
ncbi:transketolase C-terminal domain-containing protein [Beduinella massiliensis]|uniref:transketolase C-terminal domain-containing protein n=1 Tax=Beduinella massiliensis TaxID=1852363 RepID=UPI000C85284B